MINTYIKNITNNDKDYLECIEDIIANDDFSSLENFIQHGTTTCLRHSIDVSYKSYRFCKKFNLNYKAAARGGLLHDFFLYDWHKTAPKEGIHGFIHPKIAHKNAMKRFELDKIEQDIILKHMWPLTIVPPKYGESFVICLYDKYCSILEALSPISNLLRKPALLKK